MKTIKQKQTLIDYFKTKTNKKYNYKTKKNEKGKTLTFAFSTAAVKPIVVSCTKKMFLCTFSILQSKHLLFFVDLDKIQGSML